MHRFWLAFGILLGTSLQSYGQELAADSLLEESIATLRDRSRNVQARSLFHQAKRYEQEGELTQAQQALDQAISLKHDYEDALWLRAKVHQRNNNFSKALTDYQSVLFLDPTLTEPRFERAQLLYQLERYEEAIGDFRYLLENELGETTTVYFRGADQVDSDGTTSFATESISTVQSGMEADIWNFMGLSYLALEDYKKAITYFELTLNQLGPDASTYNNLGLASTHSGDTLQAIEYYQQAVLLEPEHSEALSNFSHLTRKYNRLDILEKTFARLPSSKSSSALLHEGMMLHQQGSYQRAIEVYNKAIDQSPDNAELYLQRGFATEKLAEFQNALRDYTQAIALDTYLEKAYVNRGNVYYKIKEFSLAERDYLTALQLDAENAKTYYNLGLVYHRKRQMASACQSLERASALGYSPATEIIHKICDSQ